MTFIVQLDPPAAAPAGRTMFDLNSGPIRVGGSAGGGSGIDWGDAAVTAYQTQEGQFGNSVSDFVIPNRTITIQMLLGADESGSEEAVRDQLQQKVALLQREGGVLLRQRPGGSAAYADIQNATLTLPDVWGETGGIEPNVQLVLDCLPDFYGDEITLDQFTATGIAEKVLTAAGAQAVIQGDYPARARIIVKDTSGNDQHGLLWGVRSRHYDAASTADLVIPAAGTGSLLTLLGASSHATVAGSRSSTVVQQTNLSPVWRPVAGLSGLTHVGSYRAWARVQSTSGTSIALRFAYSVGALFSPSINDLVTLPDATYGGQWFPLDLGEVRIDPTGVGTHQWNGVIQARGVLGYEASSDISIDFVLLQPLDDAAGRLIAPINPSIPLTDNPISADDFEGSTVSALNGRALEIGGGTWSVPANAGSISVYAPIGAAGNTVVVSQTAATQVVEAYAPGGTTADTAAVSVDFMWSALPAGDSLFSGVELFGGLFRLELVDEGFSPQATLQFGGAGVTYGSVNLPLPSVPGTRLVPGTWYTLTALAYQGMAYGWLTLQGAPLGEPNIISPLSGTGHTGTAGFKDETHTQTNSVTRSYDNFATWKPSSDAVMRNNATAEARWDGMIRSEATGTYYGPVGRVIGDLARIPPSGVENRPAQVLAKPTRSDLAAIPDAGANDGFTVQVKYRPCWLSRP